MTECRSGSHSYAEGRGVGCAARSLPRFTFFFFAAAERGEVSAALSSPNFFFIFFCHISAAAEGGGVGCAARTFPRLQDRDTGGL